VVEIAAFLINFFQAAVICAAYAVSRILFIKVWRRICMVTLSEAENISRAERKMAYYRKKSAREMWLRVTFGLASVFLPIATALLWKLRLLFLPPPIIMIPIILAILAEIATGVQMFYFMRRRIKAKEIAGIGKADRGFELVCWNPSYGRKFMRTPRIIPISIAANNLYLRVF
jgi:hypothetical protein